MDIKVGTGATLAYPSDRHPYVVVRVVSEKCIEVAKVEYSGQPADYHNGWPVHDKTYTQEELDAAVKAAKPEDKSKAYRRKDGRFYLGGTRLGVGTARHFRDYSD